MPVYWGGRAWLAGHMKYRVLLARPLFPVITSHLSACLSRLVSSLCPRDELSSASHQPCLPVAACRRLDASCALFALVSDLSGAWLVVLFSHRSGDFLMDSHGPKPCF